MQYFIKKKIGKNSHTFVFEGKNLFDVIYQSKKLSFGDVDNCGVCGSDNLDLNARITKKDELEYVEVKCLKCRASLVFGRMKKSQDTFYYRRKDDKSLDWVAYNPNVNIEDSIENE